jgi:hypothetical protein
MANMRTFPLTKDDAYYGVCNTAIYTATDPPLLSRFTVVDNGRYVELLAVDGSSVKMLVVLQHKDY